MAGGCAFLLWLVTIPLCPGSDSKAASHTLAALAMLNIGARWMLSGRRQSVDSRLTAHDGYFSRSVGNTKPGTNDGPGHPQIEYRSCYSPNLVKARVILHGSSLSSGPTGPNSETHPATGNVIANQ